MTEAAGEFVAIIGQSVVANQPVDIRGALDIPTEGSVLIDGVNISTLTEDGLAALRNRVIGLVFRFHYLLDELRCLENAVMPLVIPKEEVSRDEEARGHCIARSRRPGGSSFISVLTP